MDRDKIAAELSKPLDKKHVKPPAPGRYGEYIEGWFAISEANRIFGWDGWSYEITDLREVYRELLELTGRNGEVYQQWRVSYEARCTVYTGGRHNTDVGYGHGQAKPQNIGDAIESAGKEAATDALKRALKSFGYPLGLALYDKSKANVSDDPDAAEREIAKLHSITSLEELQSYWRALVGSRPEIAKTPSVIEAKDEMKAKLGKEAA